MNEPIIHPGEVFIDSGAWSMFQRHVLKSTKKAEEETGEKNYKLSKSANDNAIDYSFYSFKRGSEFRSYLDRYAEFMTKWEKRGYRWFATVDAIGNGEITWKAQEYFEKEHGLRPVPIVHFNEPLSWFHRYLEKGYDMIGIGGLATLPKRTLVKKWVDGAFRIVCPRSNGYLPLTRVHGFAVTSFEYLMRWPWYSVDSTSFLIYASYGMILVPPFLKGSKRTAFDFLKKPIVTSVSAWGRQIDYDSKIHVVNTIDRRSTKALIRPEREKFKIKRGVVTQGMIDFPGGAAAHYNRTLHHNCMAWLEYIGAELGETAEDGTVISKGISNDNALRVGANVRYYKELAEHLPKYPWPFEPTKALSWAVLMQ
jgi:hypothetical protein